MSAGEALGCNKPRTYKKLKIRSHCGRQFDGKEGLEVLYRVLFVIMQWSVTRELRIFRRQIICKIKDNQ